MLPSGKTVAELQPLFDEIQNLPCTGMIITGLAPPESGFDIYSRVFCPKLGIKEVMFWHFITTIQSNEVVFCIQIENTNKNKSRKVKWLDFG